LWLFWEERVGLKVPFMLVLRKEFRFEKTFIAAMDWFASLVSRSIFSRVSDVLPFGEKKRSFLVGCYNVYFVSRYEM
jgi:hypothetical protein